MAVLSLTLRDTQPLICSTCFFWQQLARFIA